MELKINIDNRFDIKLSDSDIVNSDEIEYADMNGREGNSLFVIYSNGFVVCAVWAYELSDALDEAADCGMMDRYLIDESDYAEYGVNTDNPTCSLLGDAVEPYDIENLGYVELSAPVRSNCAELEASTPKVLNWSISATGTKNSPKD